MDKGDSRGNRSPRTHRPRVARSRSVPRQREAHRPSLLQHGHLHTRCSSPPKRPMALNLSHPQRPHFHLSSLLHGLRLARRRRCYRGLGREPHGAGGAAVAAHVYESPSGGRWCHGGLGQDRVRVARRTSCPRRRGCRSWRGPDKSSPRMLRRRGPVAAPPPEAVTASVCHDRRRTLRPR